MNLPRLSGEVFVGITDLLLGHHILRLWLCGDHLLHQRLATGAGCTSLTYRRIPSSESSWPLLPSYLGRLERLIFTRRNGNTYTLSPGPEHFASLPKTLRELRIEIRFDLSVFFQFMTAHPSALSHLQTLCLPRTAGSEEFVTIGWPRSLTSLRADLGYEVDVDASLLPTTLTNLDVKCRELTNFPIKAPLTSLVLHQTSKAKDPLGSLQPTLETLRLRFYDQWIHRKAWNWRNLPRNLLTLEVEIEELTRAELVHFPASLTVLLINPLLPLELPELGPYLPPNLKSLRQLSSDEVKELDCLPRSLTEVVTSEAEPLVVSLSSIPRLPRNLRDVCICPSGGGTVEAIDASNLLLQEAILYCLVPTHVAWPSTLTSMSVNQCCQTHEGIMALPKTLTRLKISFGPPSWISLLPHGLHTLDLTIAGIDQASSEEIAAINTCNFPKTLECLKLHHYAPTTAWLGHHLPQTLKSLEMVKRTTTSLVEQWSEQVTLPPSVTHLALNSHIICSSWSPFLNTIKLLPLISLEIDSLDPPSTLEKDDYLALPKTLQQLNVRRFATQDSPFDRALSFYYLPELEIFI